MRLGAFLLVCFIPCLGAGQPYTLARVVGQRVNVRLGPGTEWPVLGTLGQDAHAIICGKRGGWCRVFLPRSFHVFVNAADLSAQGKQGVCERETVARLQPGRTQQVVGTIAKGTTVRLVRQYGIWWAVEPPLSLTGFMSEDYLVTVKPLERAAVERIERRKVLPVAALPRETAAAAPSLKQKEPEESSGSLTGTREGTPPGEGRAQLAPASRKTGMQDSVRIAIRRSSKRIRLIREAFARARKGRIVGWDLSEARKLCEDVLAASEATEDEKKFAKTVLAEIEFIGRAQRLLKPHVTAVGTASSAEEKERKEVPLAVGWVRGQGKYVGRAGTHVLEKGGKTLFYLVADGVDLDACVNRLVAIEKGTVEDLPPRYGTRLIRVQSVKVLTPSP